MAANTVLYGFMNLKDRFADRVVEVGVQTIYAAIDETLAEHNRQMDALMALFATQTTAYTMKYKTPVAARLQPLDEHARARPVLAMGHYDIAFPLQGGGIAWGETWLAAQKATVQDANNTMATMLTADKRWVRDHILAALYSNANWTFDDPQWGNLTIKGLANGDTDTYLLQAGSDSGATDTHYLAQAAAIADATDPYPTIYTELMEHPENSGDVVALIPTGLKATTEALTGFYPTQDGNLRYGNGATVLANPLGVTLPGQLIGYHEARVFIAEWKALPAGYIVAVATGGERALAMREDPESSLQGFKRVADRNDYPYYEAQYLRRLGFGAKNRVGAVIQRVSNGSYAIPVGYESPMG